jgi:hypothetical protein
VGSAYILKDMSVGVHVIWKVKVRSSEKPLKSNTMIFFCATIWQKLRCDVEHNQVGSLNPKPPDGHNTRQATCTCRFDNTILAPWAFSIAFWLSQLLTFQSNATFVAGLGMDPSEQPTFEARKSR